MATNLPGAQQEHGPAKPSPAQLLTGVRTTLLAILVAASGPAWSQAHVSKEGAFTLRASTVSSETLPASTAKANGIERDPRRGVLNVTIRHKEGKREKNMRGDVSAIAQDLTGQKRDIPMKEVDSNGYVSYLGTYDFVRGEVIDFLINAKPKGSERKLSLTFRDRMWLAR